MGVWIISLCIILLQFYNLFVVLEYIYKKEKSLKVSYKPYISNMERGIKLFTLSGAVLVACQVRFSKSMNWLHIWLFCEVFCEVGKHVTNYSIQYYNGGSYPLPQTLLVIMVEIIKLFTTIARTGCQIPSMDLITIRQSLKFLIPSICYAVNNNIYFVGLLYVPPPIWIILCSFRTVITATLYKVCYQSFITL